MSVSFRTILRLIAGLRPHHPSSTGSVRVAGRPVEGPGADRGMVFQDYASFDHRTVLENVVFGLECKGVPRKNLKPVLGRTTSRTVELHYGGRFSGMIVDPAGWVLTVAANLGGQDAGETVRARLLGTDDWVDAEIVNYDLTNGVALLKLPSDSLRKKVLP